MEHLRAMLAHEPAVAFALLGIFCVGLLAGVGLPAPVLAIAAGLVVLAVAFSIRAQVYPRAHVEGQMRTGDEGVIE